MNLEELQKKHPTGVQLLKERDLYNQIVSEVQFLIKYIDDQFFRDLFTENLFNDMRGVFGSFVRQDLKRVYFEMQHQSDLPLERFYEREYMHLSILQKCTTNLRYQVKSLIRMPQIKELEFKSTFLKQTSKKLNGEIQDLYKSLSQNYKKYFRLQFSIPNLNDNKISLICINQLNEKYDAHFISVVKKFYQIFHAISFVKELFHAELENEIKNRIASIYFERQDKIEKIIEYFITDFKKNFIRTIDRNLRSNHDYAWIQNGFEKFIESDRFAKLLKRIIHKGITNFRIEKKSILGADIF